MNTRGNLASDTTTVANTEGPDSSPGKHKPHTTSIPLTHHVVPGFPKTLHGSPRQNTDQRDKLSIRSSLGCGRGLEHYQKLKITIINVLRKVVSNQVM